MTKHINRWQRCFLFLRRWVGCHIVIFLFNRGCIDWLHIGSTRSWGRTSILLLRATRSHCIGSKCRQDWCRRFIILFCDKVIGGWRPLWLRWCWYSFEWINSFAGIWMYWLSFWTRRGYVNCFNGTLKATIWISDNLEPRSENLQVWQTDWKNLHLPKNVYTLLGKKDTIHFLNQENLAMNLKQ